MARNTYRLFRCRLTARRMLTPHMIRLTFTGEDLELFGDTLLDQRIKVVLGSPEALASVPDTDNWFVSVREAGEAIVMRTYTVAGLRPETGELDVDFVSHGTNGPASRFALEGELGAPVLIAGPDKEVPGHETSGLAWRPGPSRVLLVGDETALPAIVNILTSLPAHATGHALVELPTPEDAQDITVPAGVRVQWCPRSDPAAEPGSAVIPALEAILTDIAGEPSTIAADDDGTDEILWHEATDRGDTGEVPQVWIAGETAWVRQTRRLTADAGIGRDRCSFMGYWKYGESAPS